MHVTAWTVLAAYAWLLLLPMLACNAVPLQGLPSRLQLVASDLPGIGYSSVVVHGVVLPVYAVGPRLLWLHWPHA